MCRFRFFCPPPCFYLKGKGFEKKKSQYIQKKKQTENTTSTNNSNSSPIVSSYDVSEIYPMCFVNIGSNDQPTMQQLMFEEKVSHVYDKVIPDNYGFLNCS